MYRITWAKGYKYLLVVEAERWPISAATYYVQGGPKVVTPTLRLIARRFVAHSDTYLVNMMLLSTIRGSNSLKYSTCSFRTTPF